MEPAIDGTKHSIYKAVLSEAAGLWKGERGAVLVSEGLAGEGGGEKGGDAVRKGKERW